jgi:hypothetical protein
MGETQSDEVSFAPPAGEQLSVELDAIDLHEQVTVWSRLTLDQWDRVVDEALFHVETDIDRSSFVSGATIELQLQLDESVQAVDSEDALRRRMSDTDDELARTESWHAVDLQEDLSALSVEEIARDTLDGSHEIHPPSEYEGEIADDSVLEVVTAYLDADDWPYRIVETETDLFVRTAVEFDHGQEWDVAIHIEERAGRCLVYSTYPEPVPDATLPDVGATLLAENYDYINSAFEVEPRTGELSFRTIVRPETESFEDLLLENVFGMNSIYEELAEQLSDC